MASSEAEVSHLLESRFATLERGGDVSPARGWIRYPRARRRCGAQSRVPMGALERGGDRSAVSRGDANGPHAELLCVLSFLLDWKEAVGLRGLSRLTCVCVFRVILVPRLGCL